MHWIEKIRKTAIVVDKNWKTNLRLIEENQQTKTEKLQFLIAKAEKQPKNRPDPQNQKSQCSPY